MQPEEPLLTSSHGLFSTSAVTVVGVVSRNIPRLSRECDTQALARDHPRHHQHGRRASSVNHSSAAEIGRISQTASEHLRLSLTYLSQSSGPRHFYSFALSTNLSLYPQHALHDFNSSIEATSNLLRRNMGRSRDQRRKCTSKQYPTTRKHGWRS
jgi:hypothetical protein